MPKHQSCGVEKLPSKTNSFPAICASVVPVAADRVPDRRHVSADLVRPPGLETNPQQAGPGQPLDHLEVSHGRAGPIRARGDHRTARPVAADRGVDRAALGVRVPGDEGQVLADDLAAPHHPPQALVHLLGAGQHEQAGRIPIEAVNDPRPLGGPPGGACSQGVCQRRAAVARRRVGHHAGWLVHDEQVLVLVDRLEWHRGGRRGGPPLVRGHDHDVPRGEPVVLRRGPAADRHPARADQPLGRGPGGRRAAGREERVEPCAGVIRPDRELQAARSGQTAPPATRFGLTSAT
jgi:hypothetical protein